jgi:ribosomal protein S18 acetylase RimI-like enzyme
MHRRPGRLRVSPLSPWVSELADHSAGFPTAPRHQGQGVATALMRRLLELPSDEFVLRDIKDTNVPALGLYTKLGFTEVQRRRVRFAKRAGFTAYVSMGLSRAKADAAQV